jgi:hypothetical protein
MANFPPLRPATVLITPGAVPATLQVGYDGSTTTSTADLVASGDSLTLTFEGLTEAQAQSVPDHQLSQRGKSFGFDPVTLATALTPAGFQWTYARPIGQDDIQAVAGSEFYRLTCEFVGVWIRRASTPSASARLELRTTAARALPAGTPSASATLQLTPTAAGMATGTPSQSAFLLLRTTPANARIPTGEDFYWAETLLLCGFSGTNGSQSFVDEGPLGLSLSAVGNAEISTEQSVFGGSSLKLTQPDFDSPASAVQLPTDSRLVIQGEATLEARIRMRSVKNHTILGKGSGAQAGIDSSDNNMYMIYFNGQAFQSYFSSINTWLALKYTRALNAAGTGWVYYYFVNGDLVMTRDSEILGPLDFSGARIGWVTNKGAHAYIDELRLTAACRGIAPYTVDTAPFPRT